MSLALYPYFKVLHLLFVIAWMAGIFYLPRILVHYVEGQNAGEDVRRLKVMARKLYAFSSAVGGIGMALGVLLWLAFGVGGGWLYAKLVMVAALLGYQISTRAFIRRMQRDEPLPRAVTLRWYNELPVLILLVILWLVIVKPF